MRQASIVLILVIGLFFWSCEKKAQNQGYPFEGELLRINPDCGIYEINITKGLDEIIELCGASGGIYIAANLPDSLKKVGLIVEFNGDKPLPGQLTACTTMGPSFKWIWIKDAKRK